MNIFGTILTYSAPSSNYRGESAENRSVIQKITRGRFEYAIISPEAIRNAIRETLTQLGVPCNRERLHDEAQLAVKFKKYPDPDSYADDFFMGWLVAAGATDRTRIRGELQAQGRDPNTFTFKRDSILRTNMAVALEPYRYDSVFTQSPLNVDSPWKNADSSQLLHRETVYTAYQYPFALNLNECGSKPDWTRKLIAAIGQLNNVAGNHARSYFEMAPASVVVRLTDQLVAGFDTYGFRVEQDGVHKFPEVVDGIMKGDYPGNEFYFGGRLVKDMSKETAGELQNKGAILAKETTSVPVPKTVKELLQDQGATLDRNPRRLLEKVANAGVSDVAKEV